MSRRVLVIGYVWPEPHSSAAGLREIGLIESLTSFGWEVWFASAAQSNLHRDALRAFGIRTHTLELNRSSADSWFQELDPDFVIFDRFVTEEQFGSRVREACPSAVTVVDTQDLHCLRRFRGALLRSGIYQIPQIQSSREGLFESEDFLREMASLLRSDGALILSDYELRILEAECKLPKEQLHLFRFVYPSPHERKPYEGRSGFATIGNFRHAPNWDAVQWLVKEIWPRIREILPDEKLSIYGSYPSREAMALHDPGQGVHVLGSIDDHISALESHRLTLAPLRFGAGIKGKISDSWFAGTPVATTPIGAEGMVGEGFFPGLIHSTVESFAEASVALYQNTADWTTLQHAGFRILDQHYSVAQRAPLRAYLEDLLLNRTDRRRRNWLGRLLLLQSMNATKYMTRWIELKETRENPGTAPDLQVY